MKETRFAASHPRLHEDTIIARYNGKEYFTTNSMLKCARRTFKDLEMLSDVNATFYGEGLVQDMSRTLKLNRIKQSGIAFMTSKTPGIIKPNDRLERFKECYSNAFMVRASGG